MCSKLLSGRLWLTVITGLVFAWCAWSKQLNSEAVCAIISTVFVSYFTRDRASDNNGSEKPPVNKI